VKTYGRNRLFLGKAVTLAAADGRAGALPLIFHYNLGIEVKSPYKSDRLLGAAASPHLYCAAGRIEQQMYIEESDGRAEIAVTGLPRFPGVERFQRGSPSEVPELVGPASARASAGPLRVFFAPQGVVLGYMGEAEHIAIVSALHSAVRLTSRLEIRIKAHPGDTSGLHRFLERRHGCPQLRWIASKQIEWSDVTITKFSAVGLEAMLAGRTLVTICADPDSPLGKIYGAGSLRFTSADEAADLLVRMAEDSEMRAALMMRRRAEQETFIRQYFQATGERAAVNIVRAVCGRLSRDSSHANRARLVG
jgi:hypothetical protein